ncbi:hypothetical protein EG359_02720 [Chryseobacterium joostei]|uniref:DUF7336 domain-containing protein n=1 Tax=Chryseobacterium joostei TaxID=112234 RepID=A0A1N7HYQ1_9FLAO|nr:hypothetical protein [Chryseobacterium joostei]AZA98582.1 hypothetical protein EG359_02720 [Chryseobacterium joostei]SIS29977.1 hypothetical protein SAMN05421768_101819 [Chryseobacterium joostei]
MKNFIYTLEHIYRDESHTDCKLLGFFDDLRELERIKNIASKFSGFKDYPHGFTIKKNELDKVHWNVGFHTIVGEIGRDYLPDEDLIDEDTYIAQNLKSIFSISHIYTVDTSTDDERIIGAFSNLVMAEQVVEQLKEQPGFKDYPENFIIDEVELNQLLWTSGF